MKVAIVDDSRLARLELRNQLQHCPDIECVGEASDVQTALALIASKTPDLLLDRKSVV